MRRWEGKKVIFVDLDETLCRTPNLNYDQAYPIPNNVDKINRMHGMGHTIVIWTARGATTGVDWRELTEEQLTRWGVQFDELRMGKPYYDVFIDDKNFNVSDLEGGKLRDLEGE